MTTVLIDLDDWNDVKERLEQLESAVYETDDAEELEKEPDQLSDPLIDQITRDEPLSL